MKKSKCENCQFFGEFYIKKEEGFKSALHGKCKKHKELTFNKRVCNDWKEKI